MIPPTGKAMDIAAHQNMEAGPSKDLLMRIKKTTGKRRNYKLGFMCLHLCDTPLNDQQVG